ncbi:MAG: hypothetical protein HC764_26380 [Pleurocapsa sp. CRU_1_2]|nr:hypothetical protein [Pleurocapsa sp. CRU_1_2]
MTQSKCLTILLVAILQGIFCPLPYTRSQRFDYIRCHYETALGKLRVQRSQSHLCIDLDRFPYTRKAISCFVNAIKARSITQQQLK